MCTTTEDKNKRELGPNEHPTAQKRSSQTRMLHVHVHILHSTVHSAGLPTGVALPSQDALTRSAWRNLKPILTAVEVYCKPVKQCFRNAGAHTQTNSVQLPAQTCTHTGIFVPCASMSFLRPPPCRWQSTWAMGKRPACS